jgi:hypothetical protein
VFIPKEIVEKRRALEIVSLQEVADGWQKNSQQECVLKGRTGNFPMESIAEAKDLIK